MCCRFSVILHNPHQETGFESGLGLFLVQLNRDFRAILRMTPLTVVPVLITIHPLVS